MHRISFLACSIYVVRMPLFLLFLQQLRICKYDVYKNILYKIFLYELSTEIYFISLVCICMSDILSSREMIVVAIKILHALSKHFA